MPNKHPTGLAHRSLLDHPPGFRPFPGPSLFERIGGQPAVGKLVDLLYDGIEHDDRLRPLFPRDLAGGRRMQKLFFAEWLGGPGHYSEQAYTNLKHSHDGRAITPMLAGRWLGHFRRAMAATIADERDREVIFAQVRSLAMALVNGQVAPARPAGQGAAPSGKDRRGRGSPAGATPVAWCGIGARTVERARGLAHRGDADGLAAVLVDAPDLLLPAYAAAIMHSAALAGRATIVQMLLDLGAGADHPFWLPVSLTGVALERVIFVTPVCAARMKRRPAVESLLLAAGASEDVFTSAFLGDLTTLGRMLVADPSLATASDPAVAGLRITPAEHAVAGGQAAALRLILNHTQHPLPGYVRALRAAASQGSLPMTELLLAHGADATRIGAGRWVLHPELAPLLASQGACVPPGGSWIGASCTGNQGRKDDPEYVGALLNHGARATDRRTGETGVGALNATALHYAAKAGFLRTIEILLDHGADPAAQDSHGRTPLDWLQQAAPTAPRAEVRKLLTPGN